MKRRLFSIAILLLGLIPRAACAEPATQASLHDQLVTLYLDGKWDDLNALLIAQARGLAALGPVEKADVDYIRRAVSDGRPSWWKLCKGGKPVRFRPLVWGRSLNASYAPGEKETINISTINDSATVALTWNAKSMDDPAALEELPFTRGESLQVDVWDLLGTAEGEVGIPVRALLKMTEADRAALNRFLEFRAHVTSACYAGPRARRLALWQSISGWSHEYENVPTVMSRKAVGILFAVEFFSHEPSYPTLKRPEEPPADGAESKMIWSLQEQIRQHGLSFAEDRALREAIRAFAAANASEPRARSSGKLTLPGGLFIGLDPAADKPLAVQRDAWIKSHYAKPAAAR